MSYQTWGFKKNPFETTSLAPTKEGSDLLVGRNSEVKKLQNRLANSSKYTTVEGLNGVGKTSLVNVAVYRRFSESIGTSTGLLIPCFKVFQFSSDVTVSNFKETVLLAAAQTLFEAKEYLPIPSGNTKDARLIELERWMNSPFIRSFSGGIAGAMASLSSSATGGGYERSGVFAEIERILDRLAASNVFVVCILDNLELLETSDAARIALENLRDPVLNISGLRWVLCGALGIMYGVASSSRLSGYLQKPLTIEDLDRKYAREIYQSRVAAYLIGPQNTLPLSEDNFAEIFKIYRGNIREVLSAADEFCTYASDAMDDEVFSEISFDTWLHEEIQAAMRAVSGALKGASKKVFLKACEKEVFSPSDHLDFGYDSPMALRPQIKILEDLGLLKSSKDEKDKRRKNIQVLPKGWLVHVGITNLADS
jgi:hypothetical protein